MNCIEISGESDSSFEDAIRAGLTRAVETFRGIEAVQLDGEQLLISEGKVSGFRVTLTLSVAG
ncbi:MAG: dodecin family protein [Polyangiaceae bacterium]